LKVNDMDVPAPGFGQACIDIKAIGVNRAEALFRRGVYIEQPILPAGLGLEAAGIVESVGDGVDGLVPGQSVSLIPPISMATSPTYGDRGLFPARMLVPNPPQLDVVGAAALWMAYLTAYGALVEIGRVRQGDVVAISAASSSVGLAAIQIANMLGARPVALTRTSRKIAALRDHGAADAIATDEGGVGGRLRAISGSVGVRVALDAVAGPLLAEIASAMASEGLILEYGGLSASPTLYPLDHALPAQIAIRGYLVHHVTGDPARLGRAKSFILQGLESGRLRPVVDRTFPLARIADAHRYLESGDQFGKIVVTT